MNIFVFDIETVPDVDNGRRIYDIPDLDDANTAEAMFALRREATGGSDFLPLHLHRIVAISVVLKSRDKLKVWSLGEVDASESELLKRFFDGLERFTPTLVSWNGSGFDLPVIHYRSLLHGIPATRYWEVGDDDQQFRWNNYLNRYHYRHTDLMDILAGYQARANAPLDHITTMLGAPGKMGMDGSKVWGNYLKGDLEGIRNYCETDVLNTYLVYCRFELIRGKLSQTQYEEELMLLKDHLKQEDKPHFQEFLSVWTNSGRDQCL